MLLPVDPLEKTLPQEAEQIQIASQIKYLGINISRDPNQYIADNMAPLLDNYKRKIKALKQFPQSVAGQCNLIKMVWMLQLLYVLQNSPVWIYKK